MNRKYLLLIFFLTFLTCEKDDFSGVTDSAINFDVSEWILKDRDITCLDFDQEENALIGSGSNLIF